MTHSIHPNPAAETSAADRVRAFLNERKGMRGLDPEVVLSANGCSFSIADLQTLVHQADSLRHYQPFTHRNIEAQYQGVDGPTDSA